MYSLLRNAPRPEVIAVHAPALLVAFGIATLFYKFGNFALECIAFLATWFAIDFAIASVRTSRRMPGLDDPA